MGNENREGMEIDIQKLLFACLDKWRVLVACIVLAGMIAAGVTINFVTPLYQARVTLYVNNAGSDMKAEYITANNLQTAQMLVNTYIYIIGSETVLEKVADEANLGMTTQEIRACMNARQKDETEIFDVIITHPNPKKAARLANAVADVAPREIERFVEGSSSKVIDYAKVPEVPSSPSLTKNTFIGCLLGAMFAVAAIMIHTLLDVRIKNEDDLTDMFDIPVLGQIPNFYSEKSKARVAYERKNIYAMDEENGGENE